MIAQNTEEAHPNYHRIWGRELELFASNELQKINTQRSLLLQTTHN
jgi:hypothetical protein